jgi:hypothetical protein
MGPELASFAAANLYLSCCRCLSVINDGELPSDHDIMIGPTLKTVALAAQLISQHKRASSVCEALNGLPT